MYRNSVNSVKITTEFKFWSEFCLVSYNKNISHLTAFFSKQTG